MKRFDDVFARVIGVEGGYSNNPVDAGGPTRYGITQAVARAHGYTDDMRDFPILQAKAIYTTDYWNALQCDSLGPPIDEFIFDYGVNSGVAIAARSLQRAVGALPDGKIGPMTLTAVKAKTPLQIIRVVFVDRALTYARQSTAELGEFGHGWYARLFDKTVTAIKGDTNA